MSKALNRTPPIIDRPWGSVHNTVLMRRLMSIQVSLAFVLAFLLSPFLHLHDAARHEHSATGLHEHPAIAHTHPVVSSPSSDHHNLKGIGAPEAEHKASPLATFNFTQGTPLALPFDIKQERLQPDTPKQSSFAFCSFTTRTHDPPLVEAWAPRGPPV